MKRPLMVGVFTLIFDQLTKYLVIKYIWYASVINVIPIFHFFNITNIHNTGIAFSVFQGRNKVFCFLISIFLSAFTIWLYKCWKKLDDLQKYAFCLIISGGSGNLLDRFFRGEVVDFLDFGINSIRWPSFNVADSCVCIAMFLIAIDVLFFSSENKSS